MTPKATRLVAVGLMLTTIPASAAVAAGIGRERAAAIAKRAASAQVERFGISYPPNAWKADCQRFGSGWRCTLGTGGQGGSAACSQAVLVGPERPAKQRVPQRCSSRRRLRVRGDGARRARGGVDTGDAHRQGRTDQPRERCPASRNPHGWRVGSDALTSFDGALSGSAR
jgi:hypothetical protein